MTDISWLAIAPETLLAVGAAAVLLVDVQWKPPVRVLGAITGMTLLLAAAAAVVQWPVAASPALSFSGMIVLDPTAVFGRFAVLSVTALGIVAGWELFERLGRRAAEGLALVLLAATGFAFMASSVHLVMIFMGLEIGSISLYVLAGITRENRTSDEAAMKYFLLGSAASAVFVYGVALVYAGTGGLNLLAIQSFLGGVVLTRPAVLLIGIALLVVGLGFKITAAPFHSWAPDVYQGAPAGVVGFMAAAAKLGGFAALTRILFSAFPLYREDWAPVVAGIAALSVVVGTVLAIVQTDVRRLLAYSGVAHAGFILTGIVAGGTGGPAVWFYLAVYTIQLVGAFGVVAAVGGSTRSGSDLDDYAGLAKRSPFLAAAFALLLLGMAGLPLTAGFIAKFGVFRDAWEGGFEWLVVVALLASVAALYAYLRVVVVMYMRDPETTAPVPARGTTRWAVSIAVAVTIVLGLMPRPLLDLAGDALPL
ncbi:MAG: NADH-quinone oxidoreductase subunit N [Acidimicrobiia bacterium]